MALIRDHFLLFILLIAAIGTFLWLLRFRGRLRMNILTTVIVTVLHVLYGVFCVKAFAFLESGAEPSSFSNLSIFGAVFFMPVGYFLGAKLMRRKGADVFDIFTICMVFTLACSRVNCLHAGCCGGIHFFGTAFNWPTRELEILFYLAFILCSAPRVLKQKTNGEVYPLYMLFYGALRFLMEFVRVSDSPSLLHLTHLWAAVALTLGLAIWLEQRVRQKRSIKRKKN